MIKFYIYCKTLFQFLAENLNKLFGKDMSKVKDYLMRHRVTHVFDSCQWPFGDPQSKDFYFCGGKPVENKPYCSEHCSIAYIDEKELKKEKQSQKHRKIAA